MSKQSRQLKYKRPYRCLTIDGYKIIFFTDCPISEFFYGKFKRAYLKSRPGKGFGSAPVYECWFENIYGLNCLVAESKGLNYIEEMIKKANKAVTNKSDGFKISNYDKSSDGKYNLTYGIRMKDGKPLNWEELSLDEQLAAIRYGVEIGAVEIDVRMSDGSYQTIKIPHM